MTNHRFIDALLRKPVDRTPIWVMRQAGRYLPEYRELRAKAGDFMSLCKNPKFATEVTMQPLRRFDLDAAILFSDILTIPDAMGLGLYFEAGEGPKFKTRTNTPAAIDKLIVPSPEKELSYVMEAVELISSTLNGSHPLIGFAGSPWTLACYMVQGGSSKDFSEVRALMYQEPEAMHQLLDKLAHATIAYLQAQIDSGANAVMLFDTWGGLLSTPCYKDFSLKYMQQIISGLNLEKNGKTIPTILFTKQGGQWLELMAETGVNALGLDWTVDIADAKARVGEKVALQGNLDPAILLSSPEKIKAAAVDILSRFNGDTGHIFNLGHGITPNVPPENMAALVDAVVGFKP